MNLLVSNTLSESQIEEVKQLETICKLYDKTKRELFLSGELNCYPKMNCFYLLYDGALLVGVLSIFSPMAQIAEISTFVRPERRKKGYFRQMYAAAKKEILNHGIEIILFVHESSSDDGRQMIEQRDIAYNHSEYSLIYQRTFKQMASQKNLDVRLAQEKDLPGMIQLNALAFDDSEEMSRHFVRETFNNPQMLCFVAYRGSTLIGCCNVNRAERKLNLFGLVVAPSHQGVGYGRTLLHKVVGYLSDTYDEEITLEVDSSNKAALHLYTSQGFIVQSQYDYYRYELKNELRRR